VKTDAESFNFSITFPRFMNFLRILTFETVLFRSVKFIFHNARAFLAFRFFVRFLFELKVGLRRDVDGLRNRLLTSGAVAGREGSFRTTGAIRAFWAELNVGRRKPRVELPGAKLLLHLCFVYLDLGVLRKLTGSLFVLSGFRKFWLASESGLIMLVFNLRRLSGEDIDLSISFVRFVVSATFGEGLASNSDIVVITPAISSPGADIIHGS